MHKLFIIALFFLLHSAVFAQDTIAWGPVIQLSPDSTENYLPRIATTVNTIHCIWFNSGDTHMKMPYVRSLNDGISFSQPRELVDDTTILIDSWAHSTLLSNNGVVFLAFDPPGSGTNPYRPLYSMFSYDQGTTWSYPIPSSPTDNSGIFYGAAIYRDTIVVVADNKAIAYNHVGLARTTNRGTSWSWTQDSFALQSASLALSPGTLHFTSDAGINPNVWYGEVSYRRSTNLGTTWFSTKILSDDDIYSSDYSALGSYTDNTGNTTIALVWRDAKYGGCGFGAGIPFRLSTNNGEEWREEIPLHVDNARGYLSKVAMYKNIIAVAWIDDCSHHTKVRISMNHGESWSELFDITAGGSLAGGAEIALTSTAVHVVWEEAKNGWHIFYRRAQLPVTSVKDEEQEQPDAITLSQNYPNPFNPKTSIGFSTPLNPFSRGNGGVVTLKVYDIYGSEVTTLINNKQFAEGKHSVEWNAEGIASGMYFYRLSVTNSKNITSVITKKMILMK